MARTLPESEDEPIARRSATRYVPVSTSFSISCQTSIIVGCSSGASATPELEGESPSINFQRLLTIDGGLRPMHQVKIDILAIQSLERSLEGLTHTVVILIPVLPRLWPLSKDKNGDVRELRRQEDLTSRYPRLADRLSDKCLVIYKDTIRCHLYPDRSTHCSRQPEGRYRKSSSLMIGANANAAHRIDVAIAILLETSEHKPHKNTRFNMPSMRLHTSLPHSRVHHRLQASI